MKFKARFLNMETRILASPLEDLPIKMNIQSFLLWTMEGQVKQSGWVKKYIAERPCVNYISSSNQELLPSALQWVKHVPADLGLTPNTQTAW